MHDGTVRCGHIYEVQDSHLCAATADDFVQQVIRLETFQHKVHQLQSVQVCQAKEQLLQTLQQLASSAEKLNSLRIVWLRHVAGKVIDQRADTATHAN